jgi:hypothetical protein
MTLRSAIDLSLVSAFLSYLTKKVCGKSSKKKIHRLTSVVLGLFDIRRFIFLGWLMATKKYFFPYGSYSIKDDSGIRFWEDKCLSNASIQEQYPTLYNIRHKSDTLAKVLESYPPNVMVQMDLNGPRLEAWNSLLMCLARFHLTQGID